MAKEVKRRDFDGRERRRTFFVLVPMPCHAMPWKSSAVGRRKESDVVLVSLVRGQVGTQPDRGGYQIEISISVSLVMYWRTLLD